MKYLLIPAFLVTFLLNGFSQGSGNIYSEIIIPKIQLSEATYSEAIDFLRAQGKHRNPQKVAINVNSLSTPPENTRLNLTLNDVSLLEALTAVADQVGFKVIITSYGLLIGPPDKLPAP